MRLDVLCRAAAFTILAVLAGCQQPVAPTAAAVPQPDPVPVAGVGYVLFNAPIMPESRTLLIQDLDKLRNAGATEIDIAINSAGGQLDAAEDIVDYLRRMHSQNGMTFKVYNVGLVASAATYVFLNAQERYASPRGSFVFHAAGMVTSGSGLIDAQTLREQANKIEAYEKLIRTSLKARSKLSDEEASVYLHRTVLLNSTDAQRDGIIDGVANFQAPKEARVWVIAQKPKPNPTARPSNPPPQQLGG